MKKVLAFLLAFAMILGLAACGSTPAPAPTEAPAPAQEEPAPAQEEPTAEAPVEEAGTEAEGDTWIFTDSAGREVEVPRDIRRILPSGSLAQTFMWPLAADRIISTNREYTPEQLVYIGEQYADLPVTGNLYQTGSQLNIEEVASLDAQIIVDFGEPKANITEDLDGLQELLGIPCIFIEGSFTNTADAYRTLGKLLNMPDEAEEVAQYIEGIMNKTAEVFANTDKKTLAFVNGADGLGVIAKGTYFDEIWTYMGENVATVDDSQMYWFSTVGLEQLQNWDPEFLFFYSEDAYNTAMTDPAWSELQAVKNGNCYTIPQQPIDFCFSPSVNRYLGIMWLGELMYPDQFDWNIKDEVFNYYRMFYHCEMTDELYDQLMSPGHTLPDE